jgi:hypothetical protein
MRQALLEQCSTMPNHSQIHIHSPQSPSQLSFVRKLCSSNILQDDLKVSTFRLSRLGRISPRFNPLEALHGDAD